jgi:hypothetical protein
MIKIEIITTIDIHPSEEMFHITQILLDNESFIVVINNN